VILLLLVSFIQVVIAETLPYQLEKLEVKAGDLSRFEMPADSRTINLTSPTTSSQRVERQFLNLGNDTILLDKDSSGYRDVQLWIGNYGTTRMRALLQKNENKMLKFQYNSSDGHRFHSDYLNTAVNATMNQQKWGTVSGDVDVNVDYDRISFPGAVGFETNWVERKMLGATVEGSFTTKQLKGLKEVRLLVGGTKNTGTSAIPAMSEEVGTGKMLIEAEYQPASWLGFSLYTAAERTSVNPQGGEENSMSATTLAVTGERSWNKTQLLQMVAGLKKVSSKNVQPEIDLTLRQKLDDGGRVRVSLGRSTELVEHQQILASQFGYVNVFTAAGKSIFAGSVYPVQISDYLKVSYNRDFALGSFKIDAELENIDDQLTYTIGNLTDARLAVSTSGEGSRRKALRFSYRLLLSSKISLTLAGMKESFTTSMGDLPFNPDGTLSLQLDWHQARNKAYLRCAARDGYNVDYLGNDIGGTVTFDFGWQHKIDNNIEAGLEMANFLNRKFEIRTGMPEQGRLTMLNVRYRF
jgi:hypothetical protein